VGAIRKKRKEYLNAKGEKSRGAKSAEISESLTSELKKKKKRSML